MIGRRGSLSACGHKYGDVAQVSKPAVRAKLSAADLEIGDTAGLETCATKHRKNTSPH